MSRILGLDLGSQSIKAVMMDSSDREHPVASYVESPRPSTGESFATLKTALTTLLAQHPAHVDQVVVALPGASLATHMLTMPFNDPRRIEAALPFEVESQIPFDLHDAIFDYQIVRRLEDKTDLLVGVVRRTDLEALLETLQELGLDPRVVTHPGIAFQSLLGGLERPEAPGEHSVAILDIGHERTTLAIGQPGGELELVRTFAGGGKDLTRYLANELQLTQSEASHWKEQKGSLTPNDSEPDAERAAGALIRGLQLILRELRPTLKSYTAQSHRSVSRIFLCGGTAQLKGLSEQLAQDLGVPVEPLKLPQALLEVVPAYADLGAAQAYALALRGFSSGPRASRFNLRRGNLAFKGHFDYLRERVARLAVFGATLITLFTAFGIVRNSVLSAKEQALDAQLCETTQRVLGHCEKNYDRALNMLRGKESPAAAIPKLSAVNLLAEATSRIPTDAPVMFDQIIVDLDRISLRGVTDTPKQVDKISQALKAYRCFREVKVGKLEKSKDRVNFLIDIQVDCGEQAAQAPG